MSPTKQADGKTATKKDASQWCDVGIMKGTTCVVSYYHLTSDVAVPNGEVCIIFSLQFLIFSPKFYFILFFKHYFSSFKFLYIVKFLRPCVFGGAVQIFDD